MWTTLGVVTDMMKTLRPGVGSTSNCARSTAAATEAVAASMSGVSPMTVIVSSMPPIERVASTTRAAEMPTISPSLAKGAKPLSSARTV